jgi:exopolysaccharide biosynthesis protein
MAGVKLFGNAKGGARAKQKSARPKKPLKALAIVLAVLLLLEGLYFFGLYTEIPAIANLRRDYILTAMSTMRHQWLATDFIPASIIDKTMAGRTQAVESQVGVHSTWSGTQSGSSSAAASGQSDKDAFYSLFWELDKTSMDAYVSAHPDVLANGWSSILIDESGLDGQGTSIKTTLGEQVLAVDAKNEILLVREAGSGWRGVLAIAKDPSRLSVQMASTLGQSGQTAETIAKTAGGVLAMTGSAFIDVDAQGNQGNGNGGTLSGWAMSGGTEYGEHYRYGYKRLEIHKDNLLYVRDCTDPVSSDCRDAVEFQPALIVDGKILVDANCGWTGVQPRACIGQSDKKEILMLVVEGRNYAAGILGTDVIVCANILKQHGCMQAMNIDGGTSAIMWYNGKSVTRCSNSSLVPQGRTLPNAFVYK